PRLDQEAQQLALGLLYARLEFAVGGQTLQTARDLPLARLLHSGGVRMSSIARVAPIDSQRAAVRRQFVDVEQAQAMVREYALDRSEAQVREVLVVDGIELVLVHEPQQMRELHCDDTALLQQDRHPADKVVDVGHVREDVVTQQQVDTPVLGRDFLRSAAPEEFDGRRNALGDGHFGHVRRWL